MTLIEHPQLVDNRDARGGLFLLCSLGRAADNNGWQEVNILILSPNFFNGGSAQNT